MFISSISNFNFQLFTRVLSSFNKRIYDDEVEGSQMQTLVETACGELVEQLIEATSVNMFKMRLNDWMLDVDI